MMLLLHVEDTVENRPLSTIPTGLPTCTDQKASLDDQLPWTLPPN